MKDVLKLREAAECGNVDAQVKLAILFYEGKGVKKDFDESVMWFKRAGEKGHANAQFTVGNFYYIGKYIEQDFEEAFKWYKKAAELGHVVAQYNIGTIYYNGRGVEEDLEEAVKWFEKAAKSGDRDSKEILKALRDSGELQTSNKEVKPEEAKKINFPPDSFFQELISTETEYDLESYDCTSYCLKHRRRANKKYLKEAEDVLSSVYKKEGIATEFTIVNTLIMNGGYNKLDSMHHITAAAAIWILDQLSLQNKLEDMYKFIDKEQYFNCDFEEFPLPLILHPTYDYFLIRAVSRIISQRDEGLVKSGGVNGSLVTGASPKKKANPPNTCGNRNVFNSIIDLIDKEAIEVANTRFEQKVWEFYRLSFEAKHYVDAKLESLDNEIIEIQEQIQSDNEKSSYFIEADTFVEQLTLKIGEINKLREETGSVSTCLSLVNDREKTAKRLSNLFPTELVDKLCRFSTEDPFEAAFAILYLLDADSDIPWLYYGSMSVAYTVNDQLPFNIMPRGIADDMELNTFNDVLYQHKFSGNKCPIDVDSDNESVNREFGLNLSQLMHASTGVVFPRVIQRIPQMESFLDELGVEGEDERKVYAMLLSSMNSSAVGQESILSYWRSGEIETEMDEKRNAEGETDSQDKESPVIDEIEISIEEFARQKKEIQDLKKLLHEEISRKRMAMRKTEAIANENAVINRELVDLRELVFNQENLLEQEDSFDVEIQYPININERIVVFGGHPSWLKSIRPLLPDVRFVQPEIQPNNDLIRNSDQIWIQSNYLSHSTFYKVMGIVRNYDKQVRYFRWSSAKKCAEQIVKSVAEL